MSFSKQQIAELVAAIVPAVMATVEQQLQHPQQQQQQQQQQQPHSQQPTAGITNTSVSIINIVTSQYSIVF